jgi:two-component system chemotaxis response regulator CheY
MKTCLVVDDSSVVRKIARRILEEMDFQIIEAEDGEKALEVCKRGFPDAILLDWNMPVMDGYEFLGNLRRMPGGDAPKVVFCTTSTRTSSQPSSRKSVCTSLPSRRNPVQPFANSY